jgi:hypothetical protein
MKTTTSDLDVLLARYGLTPTAVAGSDSSLAARGGVLAIVDIVPAEDGALVRVQIGETEAKGQGPITADRAAALVRAFVRSHALPADESFEHLFSHLLTKLWKLYAESGARTLSIRRLHLHPTSYHIDGIRIEPATAVHARPRREPTAGRRPVTTVPKRGAHARPSPKA